mmetsp:Transcript_30234/g.34841  ORF Transcript_30234/g.34841 Transcript_30234/m.34841 type:complete len:430 (-) Transcript_30234:352-1641(-)|eukprot:CAMPEP_0194383358 /NCGR_PEP_ID=MMETSP0174-20130528/67002_1 /TAXON_ID=216777 /ORGANISM="Proboscia alata, Strain PI-D3" /LENGTH=429 /DNA_ID=CAMNT_0039169529 /DNA_START=112 /DNA_END=1401 /DNA_ORIENTATION=-
MSKEDVVIEPLNEMESSMMLVQEPGITTITFFSSVDNSDFAATAKYFRDRLQSILQANPWAAGKVVRNRQHKNLQLVYPKKISQELLDQILVIVDDNDDGTNQLKADMPYEEICTAVDKHSAMLPSGRKCINRDTLVTRVTLVPGESSFGLPSFALIASMSHTVADGYTYYRILSMLSSKEPIEPLNATRKANIDATKVAWDPQDWKFVTTNFGMVVNLLHGMFFKPKAKCYAFYVDPKKIQAIKEEEAKSKVVDFVSTNDVLVSNHSNLVKPRIQTMAINFRNRVSGAESSDAGNYEAVLVLDKGSYSTPTQVRQAVQNYNKDATATGRKDPLPGVWEALKEPRLLGQLSNWTSFFDQLEVPSWTQELHLPVLNISKIPFDCAVMFKPKAGFYAIMYICTTPSFQNREFWQTNAPVDELVSNEIFGDE